MHRVLNNELDIYYYNRDILIYLLSTTPKRGNDETDRDTTGKAEEQGLSARVRDHFSQIGRASCRERV